MQTPDSDTEGSDAHEEMDGAELAEADRVVAELCNEVRLDGVSSSTVHAVLSARDHTKS